ncbi:MAG: hypothetical protein FWE20_09915 [Defluviitaleaceae bacterium]|nr:hypothetical protein [Defluviitaleaceae bacterium]
MKKIVSTLVAGIMVISTVIPVSAQTSDAARFMTSLDATFSQLAREYEVVSRSYEEIFDLMFRLPQSAYEMSVEMTVDIHGETAGMTQVSRSDEANNRFSSSTNLFGLQTFFLMPDISFDVYLNDDIVAVGNPNVSRNYIYVQRDMTPDQWAETEVVQAGLADYEGIRAVVEAVQLMTGSQSLGGIDFELPERLFDPYGEVIRRHLENARFTSQGEQRVPAQRGNLRTEKITANMGPVPFSNLVNDLAGTLENDETLRTFMINYLSMFELDAASIEALVDSGISEVASTIRELAELGSTFSYSLYIATNGLAVRHTANLNVPIPFVGPVNIMLNLDLLGSDFLVNELGFDFVVDALGETISLTYSQIGNNIMRGGVMDYTFALRGEFGDNFAELTGDYFWDSNIAEDNFAMDMVFEFSAPDLMGTSEVVQFTALWEGTYATTANSFILDSIITGSWGMLLGDPDAFATMLVGMRQIDPSLIGISGTGVNLAEMSANEAVTLLDMFADIFN